MRAFLSTRRLLLAAGIALFAAAPLSAQSDAERTTTTTTTKDDGFPWDLLGLLGLLGLLPRKVEETVVHRDVPPRTTGTPGTPGGPGRM